MPQTSTSVTSCARSQSASGTPSAILALEAAVGGGVLALAEDRVERLRVEVGVERCAVAADDAVRRPRVDEVGIGGEVAAGIDVVVLGRDDDVVLTIARARPPAMCAAARRS